MGRLEPHLLRAARPRRICVIKPSAFGDVVQTLPLLPVLREAYPRAEISWVINRELKDLVADHPAVHQVIPFDRRGSWWNWIQLGRRLRSEQFDLVLDLQGLLRTAVMTLATGAPMRVGLETAREGSRFSLNCLIPGTSAGVPAQVRYWRIAEALGLDEHPQRVEIPVSDADQQTMRDAWNRLPGPRIAVHVGARWKTKLWPARHFGAVLARATSQWNAGVIFVGSPAEAPLVNAAIQEMLLRHPTARFTNLAGQTSLKQLAAVLQLADVVLCNDSGPMHLAAGMGTPVLGVFTCTDPVRSGPTGSQHELVATSVPCRASYHKHCPLKGAWNMACHRELDVEMVWQGLKRLVDRHQLLQRPRHAA